MREKSAQDKKRILKNRRIELELETLESQMRNFQNSLDLNKKLSNKLKKENEKLKERNKSIYIEVEAKEKAIEGLKKDISKGKKDELFVKRGKGKLKQKIQEMEEDARNQREEMKKREREVSSATEKLEAAKQELKRVKAESLQKIKEKDLTQKGVKSKLQGMNQKLTVLFEQNEGLSLQIKTLEKEKNVAGRNCEIQAGENKILKQKVVQLEERLRLSRKKIEDAKTSKSKKKNGQKKKKRGSKSVAKKKSRKVKTQYSHRGKAANDTSEQTNILNLINQKFSNQDFSEPLRNPVTNKHKIYSNSPEHIKNQIQNDNQSYAHEINQNTPRSKFANTTPTQIFPVPKQANRFETPKKRASSSVSKCRSELQQPDQLFDRSEYNLVERRKSRNQNRLCRSVSRPGDESIWKERQCLTGRSVALSSHTIISEEQAIQEINSLRNSVHSLNRQKMDVFNEMTLLGDKFANSRDENEKLQELVKNCMKTIQEYKVEVKKSKKTRWDFNILIYYRLEGVLFYLQGIVEISLNIRDKEINRKRKACVGNNQGKSVVFEELQFLFKEERWKGRGHF